MATSPKIILLDEPTSALDPISAGKIEETLYGQKDKYTMLLVTRSMQQASRISDKLQDFSWMKSDREFNGYQEDVPQPTTQRKQKIIFQENLDKEINDVTFSI